MTQDDASYYRQRASQEQRAARNATCAAARERHEELASLYRFRATLLAATLPEFRPLESPVPARAAA
jgi:hypothetical protein